MHLGFLTPEYPHPKTTPAAGIGTSIKNMVTGLKEKGVKISLFIYGQSKDEIFNEDGIKFHLIKQQNYKFLGWYLHRKFLQNYLNKAIIEEKIDAIEAPDWTGITAFMNLKCPLIIRFHGSDSYFCDLENRPQKKKNFWFEKKAILNADHFTSVSEFTAERTKNIFGLEKEVVIIPNSIDTKYFHPDIPKAQPKTILFFGSIIRKKGVLELPEIFNLLVAKDPSIKIIFAGKDVKDQKTITSTKQLILEKFSSKAKQNTSWLGVLPYNKIIDQIAKANVVVLPSFAEALPMTWLEAMAMEKALVTSNIGWAKEIMINGLTGFTVNPKDHKTYAEKILYLIENNDEALKMGRAAREVVLVKFSTETVAYQNIKYYQNVIYKNA